MTLQSAISSPAGSIAISVLLGLGLAAMFRRACKGNSCIVIKAPSRADTDKYYYKIDDECFKYKPVATSCSSRPPRK